jgi:glyoxylase-like metal-dependent hydrolase (beta-lactamase superfamily II)
VKPQSRRRKTARLIATIAAVGVVLSSISSAQQSDPIRAASEALGASRLASMRMQGFGAVYAVGQSPSPDEPWPRIHIKTFDAFVNFDTATMLIDTVRESGGIPPRGGSLPLNGERRQVQAVSDGVAWDVTYAVPPPSRSGSADRSPVPQPAVAMPETAPDRTLQIWMTPHGFLKGAAANAAIARPISGGTEVSFGLASGHRLSGVINGRGEVVTVRSAVADPVLGDMPVETVFSNYQRIGEFSFPMRWLEKRGGHPSLDVWLAQVTPNAQMEARVPDLPAGRGNGPMTVDLQAIAPGVHYITGGSHHSVVVELNDHVVTIEAPLDERRSLAVVDKVSETIRNKPIRFVINTHHHFDHAGGLRAYAALGATIITHQANRAFYEDAWMAPRTLLSDRLSSSKKAAVFETFSDRRSLGDSTQPIEIYRIENSPHADTLAMVYLPKSRLLIQADAFTPDATTPPVVSPAALNLLRNIQRLKLDVSGIVPLHGPRVATMKDLLKAVGLDGT